MKKITPKKYAYALYEMMQAAAGEQEREQYIDNFLRVVVVHRDVSALPAIVEHVAKLYDKANGTVRGTLVSATPLSDADSAAVKEQVATMIGTQTAELEHEIDESIIGGFKAIFSDRVIDASIKGQVNVLQQELKQ